MNDNDFEVGDNTQEEAATRGTILGPNRDSEEEAFRGTEPQLEVAPLYIFRWSRRQKSCPVGHPHSHQYPWERGPERPAQLSWSREYLNLCLAGRHLPSVSTSPAALNDIP
jgi:hypothetical protein